MRIRGCHTLRPNFPVCSASVASPHRCPTTPQPPQRLRFGLIPVRSPLLRESLLFSFPPGNEMFQFPGLACIAACCTFRTTGCPIRICTDPSIFAAPRAFSQLITSFIASESLGIPRTPFFTSSRAPFRPHEPPLPAFQRTFFPYLSYCNSLAVVQILI